MEAGFIIGVLVGCVFLYHSRVPVFMMFVEAFTDIGEALFGEIEETKDAAKRT